MWRYVLCYCNITHKLFGYCFSNYYFHNRNNTYSKFTKYLCRRNSYINGQSIYYWRHIFMVARWANNTKHHY